MWKLFVVLCVVVLGDVQGQRRNFSAQPCPSKCLCFRRTARCMQLQLTKIPKTPAQTVLLDLRVNNIKEIPPGTFQGNKNIRSLLLNHNLLTRLENGAFSGLAQLRHLYLYKNKIRFIEPEAFQGLNKLEHLYLHNNDLEEFKAGTFSNLPSLDRLFLYHNHIQHIPFGAFENLPKLTRLRLDQNALICDCKLAWLAKKINSTPYHVAANCKFPTNMYGKPVQEIHPQEFHCKSPEIMEGPQDIQVSWGGTAIFSCKVEGDPAPAVIWMRNDEELQVDDRYKILDNGSLIITDSKDVDVGQYECMAKNPDGEVKSRQARMVVSPPNFPHNNQLQFGPPVLDVKPVSVTTIDGAPEVKFFCRASGSPPLLYTWSRDGIQLTPTHRHFLSQDGSLYIRPVVSSDHGIYRCEVTNQFGRTSAEAYLLLNEAPVFTVYPESVTADIGKTVKLECVAVGSPKPELTWFKDNIEIEASERVYLSPDHTLLEIKRTTESDSGLYVCEARNNLGYREVSASVKVAESQYKPPKLVYKPYNIEVVAGSTIEMPCKATGNPSPGVQWRKDGTTMQINGRTKTSVSGNLYIYGVNKEDQGRYECTAINEHGRDTAFGYITVVEDPHRDEFGGVGDQFVKIAFSEASQEVDRAINNTIDALFNNKTNSNSRDLFRLTRYPDAPARELARAAEVYERTLVNIRKHVAKGMPVMNHTADFNYKEILSPNHLELIAKLSGCLAHRKFRNCSDMCFHAKYRSIDGTCNNLQHPMWGASYTGFRRILTPIYEDGFTTPIGWNKDRKYFGYPKPLSRLVSTELIATDKISPDKEITHMVMQWGQFLDHDLDHATPSVSSESWDGIDCKKSCDYAAPCYPMDIPPGDKRAANRRCIDFIRSAAICGSGMTSVFFGAVQPREQINQLTSYVDASQVYGFSEELAKDLRDFTNEGGRLREGTVFPGRKPLLPYSNGGMDCRRNLSESTVSCFLAGDIRANEQAGLVAMHTLWMREHNRLARELQFLNPHWDSDMLYHEARKIVGASMQHVTFKLWLPFIIGREGMELLGDYKGYDPTIQATISNEFATAALRFGHTLINPVLHRLNSEFKPIREGHLPLRNAFFSPWRVVDEGGIDPLLRGLFTVPAKMKKPDENLNTELTEQLFTTAHAVALDLASMNIHRAREHGIPGYTEYRKFCNMSEARSFDDLAGEISDASVREKLKKLYGHPGNIDIFAGGILEDQLPGARVGPLFRCLLIEQFRRLRDGDRFYYENPWVFKPEQLVQIKQFSLSRLLCDNGDNITRVTNNVFVLPELQGGLINCDSVPKVDLRLWSECCSDCRFSGQLNTISRLNARNRRHIDKEELPPNAAYKKYSNSTVEQRGAEYFNENKQLKRRLSELERNVHNLEATVKKMNKLVKKLENGKL